MNDFILVDKNYPRPQFVKNNWKLLNGKWCFAFDDLNIGESQKWYQNFPKQLEINVPYSYQTKDSGINQKDEHKYIWYCKEEYYEENLDNKRLLLNFEGCDYISKVWVNGVFVGSHKGGYTRFTFDITNMVKENNGKALIVVKSEDLKEAVQPRGKQTWLKEPFGCWYKETNGIWKSVWSEIVSPTYLTHMKITPCFDEYNVEFELNLNQIMANYFAKIEVFFKGQLISDTLMHLVRRITNIKLDMNNDLDGFRVHYWTPENPNLYDVKVSLFEKDTLKEEIFSYFGFRSFRSHKNCLLLNNNPIYSKMVLHQGYYRNSGLTATFEDMKNDILLAKKLGFNGIRMHQKIEDERFYYLADTLGMMIWCEMPSAYEFKDDTICNVMNEWQEVIKQNYNHPSIVAWVPLNESWGVPRIVLDSTNQHLAEALYHITKAYDKYRPTISNDGWEHANSDIVTLHNYVQSGSELTHFYSNLEDMLNGNHKIDYSQTRLPFANGYKYEGQPVIISEFAGIGYQNGTDKGWGYGDEVNSEEAYIERLTSMVKSIRNIDGVCGFCITQLTDVEQEINGLADIDRKLKAKLDELIKAINS